MGVWERGHEEALVLYSFPGLGLFAQLVSVSGV